MKRKVSKASSKDATPVEALKLKSQQPTIGSTSIIFKPCKDQSVKMRSYMMYDFMEYPNLSFRIAMIVPFTWSGAARPERRSGRVQLLIRVWFLFGAVNLIYQNLGMLIYLLAAQLQSATATQLSAQGALHARISETGAILCLTLVAACKMWILFWHGKRISVLLEEFQRLFPSASVQQQQRRRCSMAVARYRVKHYLCSSRLLMRRTTIFFIFAFIFYNLLPVIVLAYELFSTEQQTLSYRLQSNTWYPWLRDQNRTSVIAFAAAYICQLQSSLTGVAFIMAGEFMLCFFITQMRMHFDYLANALETLDAAGGEPANRQLKALIDYHNQLLRLAKEINHIFNISFLVNFATSSVAICLMGFSMIMISVLHACKYSVGLLSFLVFTLFICYNGSEFTRASDQLMAAAFYGNWYEGNKAYRKMVLFFMMRSEQPSVLTAYKFYEVSMETYMKILKSSYKLFTFFRAMGQ